MDVGGGSENRVDVGGGSETKVDGAGGGFRTGWKLEGGLRTGWLLEARGGGGVSYKVDGAGEGRWEQGGFWRGWGWYRRRGLRTTRMFGEETNFRQTMFRG